MTKITIPFANTDALYNITSSDGTFSKDGYNSHIQIQFPDRSIIVYTVGDVIQNKYLITDIDSSNLSAVCTVEKIQSNSLTGVISKYWIIILIPAVIVLLMR